LPASRAETFKVPWRRRHDYRARILMDPPATNESAQYLNIPLLVGVVGHRDLVHGEMPVVRAAVERLLRALRDAQPAVPIKLLSAQAEGADLLVADVAQELGIDIIALLPFSVAQCRADLGSDAARAAFDRTMARAERLELAPETGADDGDLVHPGTARDRQFERTGDLIARQSSLLIAIWDGLETEHRAGTARAIERRRGRADADDAGSHAQPVGLFLAADNDLMYEIRCSRISNGGAGDAGARVIGFVTGDATFGAIENGIPPTLATLLARTADFNRDASEFGARFAGQRPLSSATPQPVSGALLYLDQLFGAADWLAVHFRRCFTRALAARFSLWALMAFLLLAFKKSTDDLYSFISIVIVLLVFALGWQLAFWARRRSWDRRYVDYRALAEGLRVDFYWELSGVRARFDDAFAHESFLQKQDAQIEWMRAAMRAVNLRCALYPPNSTINGFEHTLAAWVGDPARASGSGQLNYYRQRTAALERRLAIAERISHGMLIGGLVLAVILGVDTALRLAEQPPVLGPALRSLMIMGLALLTAYTAIFEIYLAEKADRSLIRQYRHMLSLFGFAAQQLRSARSTVEKLGILRALGHACLTEHAQWILAHRDKRIDGLRW
jgi:hypothetical protein